MQQHFSDCCPEVTQPHAAFSIERQVRYLGACSASALPEVYLSNGETCRNHPIRMTHTRTLCHHCDPWLAHAHTVAWPRALGPNFAYNTRLAKAPALVAWLAQQKYALAPHQEQQPPLPAVIIQIQKRFASVLYSPHPSTHAPAAMRWYGATEHLPCVQHCWPSLCSPHCWCSSLMRPMPIITPSPLQPSELLELEGTSALDKMLGLVQQPDTAPTQVSGCVSAACLS